MPAPFDTSTERGSADQKAFARSLFGHVMQEVDVPRKMRECLVREGQRLQIGTSSLDLSAFSRVLLAAIGKAAVPMAEHAIALFRSNVPFRGVVVGVGEWQPPSEVLYFAGGHPLPDPQSFAAGAALLELMGHADPDTLVLFLISGGASAMAEAPLDPSLPPEEIIDFYRTLLHSGLPIQKINTLRKHLSAIKGGRLAFAATGATSCTLLISDVPAGMLDVVGSGLSLPDTSTVEECRTLLSETPALASISPTLRSFFDGMRETPKSLPEGRFPSICFSALSSDSLIEAAQRFANAAGYRVVVDNSCDDWDYRDAAAYLLDRLQQESREPGPVCLLSAGEVTISITGDAGQGGRNQQWALEVARHISQKSGARGVERRL